VLVPGVQGEMPLPDGRGSVALPTGLIVGSAKITHCLRHPREGGDPVAAREATVLALDSRPTPPRGENLRGNDIYEWRLTNVNRYKRPRPPEG
jgi:hypothetical protein